MLPDEEEDQGVFPYALLTVDVSDVILLIGGIASSPRQNSCLPSAQLLHLHPDGAGLQSHTVAGRDPVDDFFGSFDFSAR